MPTVHTTTPIESSFEDFGYSTTNEERYALWPMKSTGTKRGVVFCHPYGGSAAGIASSLFQKGLGAELAKNFVVAMSDQGNPAAADGDGHNNWGNNTGVTRVHQDRDWLVNVKGCDSKIVLIGMSHGGCAAFRYARQYPANVAAVVGLEPALLLSSVRQYDPALVASMDKCLGGFSSPINAEYSPTLFAASLSATLPVRIYYATDDQIIDPASVFQFKTNRESNGGDVYTDLISLQDLTGLSTIGHTDNAVGLAESDAVDWMLNFAI